MNSLQQNPVAMGMGGGFYPTPEAPPQQPQAQPFKPVYSQPISQYAPAHSPLVHSIGYGSLGHMADEPMKQPVERRPYAPTSYQYRSMRQYSHATNAYNPYYYSNQLKV
ncbi:unnamed protein product [Dibothriocephalus latus]|uniref:Uncharacterized protein n=1 Tax=Dibothriocephalus latus TaxID=60516 RepID=A0A3P7MN98_DIBLA|nr:unnamed protein product [Dibothriocephalus latus]